MNTHSIGNITTAAVGLQLMSNGYRVSLPFGDGSPYDMIIDKGEGLKTVQCKTGRIENGCVAFSAFSVIKKDGNWIRVGYDSIDYYGIYVPSDKITLLVPRVAVPYRVNVKLRVDKPKNNIKKGINWAKQYIIGDVPERLNGTGC